MRKFAFLSFFLVIFIFQSGFLVIGHRGNPTKYAEETTQSFNSAFADGADYVELDLHVSKDNQLVVSHDRDLTRITGTSAIVSQNFFSYLNTLKQANGEPVYSLAQLFSYYQKNPKVKFLIETKKTKANNPKNMEPFLVELIKKYNMQDRVMVHSFSYKSLKVMQKLMPEIPRIFIVGSLKRINFDVLSYIDGINISSKIVTPALITQLHYLKKKVFVWDQMHEDPKQWNWLVNLPIDGVVTNYPATGYQYKIAKSGTKEFKVNRLALYTGSTSTPIQENPYLNVQTGTSILTKQEVKILSGVIVNGKKYYKIGRAQYVLADCFNYNLNPEESFTYLNKIVTLRDESHPQAYDNPTSPNTILGTLKAQKQYKILGVNSNSSQTWFKTEIGWIQSKNVLIHGISPDFASDVATKDYFALPTKKRLTNISLADNALFPANTKKLSFTEYLTISRPLTVLKNAKL